VTAASPSWRRWPTALVGWWRDRPLRGRLVAAAALAVAVAVGGVVGVAYVTVRHELVGHVDTQLQHQVDELRAQAQRQAGFFPGQLQLTPDFGEPGGVVQAVFADGAVRVAPDEAVRLPVSATDVDVAAGRHGPYLRSLRAGGVEVRVLTSPLIDDIAVQVALPLRSVTDQLGGIAIAFLGLAALGIAAAVVLAWLVSRTALAPVGRLTSAAAEIAATRDLTHRIAVTRRDELGRLAASFNSMLDALQSSIAAQRQLVADASHELRTPLASLRTNVEILHDVDRLPPEARREVIDGIVRQLEELTALVGDVVELARGDEPVAHFEEVSLDRLVAHAVDRARRHWPGLRFQLVTSPVVVRAVPNRLDRAVANLLDNASKFSPAGGVVEVALFADGRLVVRDSGPGVPADALPHVFDRFFRADDARALPGSGLGLAIVKQVVERHGGSVALGNAPGGGAVATLTVPPLQRPDAPAPPAPEAAEEPAAPTRVR
jgi:two-component system, OmpR family, sensor histidine kinase MprB